MKPFFILCALLLCLRRKVVVGAGVKGVNYQISVPNQYVIEPCEQYPDKYIDKMFDISNITFSYSEDEKLLITGNTKYISDIIFDKDAKIGAELQIFKKQRGDWVSTVYNFVRTDLCAILWSPSELWYKFTEKIPVEMRKCPPELGSIYDLDFEADLSIKNSQDRNAAGDYKAQIIIKYGPLPDDLICCNMLGYIEKL